MRLFYRWLRYQASRQAYLLRQRCIRKDVRRTLQYGVADDRTSWERTFLSLWEPLYGRFSEGKALVKVDGPYMGAEGAVSSQYEGFARSFIGAAFFLHGKGESTVTLTDGEEVDLAAHYREGIVNGTNPNHKEYWGRITSKQRLVENCAVIIGILLTPGHTWNRFSEEEKEAVTIWFEESAKDSFANNNWQWFKAFHHLFLEQAGRAGQAEIINSVLEKIEHMYAGDGWYSDGVLPDRVFDYYSAWAMQYYALLFAFLAGEEYGQWKRRFMARAREFLATYRYFFPPHGHAPLYGRSQSYRWATIAPWGVALSLDSSYDDLPGIKRSLIACVNSFLEEGALRKDGILSSGYHGEFVPMLEGYISPTSQYWAFKGFSLLLLPEGHPFWEVPSAAGETSEAIITLPAAKMCLSRSTDSHTVIYPNSISRRHDLKYDKFAYSNRFLMNYGSSFPVDNSLLVRSRNEWLARDHIRSASCEEGVCDSSWSINRGSVEIHSVIVPQPQGYIAVHELINDESVEFSCGGFPLALPSRQHEEIVSEDTVVLSGDGSQVGIKLLYGEGELCVYRKRAINPCGRFSYVPYVKGRLNMRNNLIVLFLWGSKAQGSGQFPGLVTGLDDSPGRFRGLTPVPEAQGEA